MRISYLVHGYPPRENAGTEQHTRVLADAMRERGHHVSIIAATRAPGRKHAERLRLNDGVIRIVNNIPARPLSDRERDRSIEKAINKAIAESKPDILHVQHLQFLSTKINFNAKSIFTFHDAWTWCAAGGAELRPNGAVCQEPEPSVCSKCAAHWRPVQSPITRGLIQAAGRLSGVIAPERLHSAWKKMPVNLRRRLNRTTSDSPNSPGEAQARNEAFVQLINGFDRRISPSAYLARRAEKMGMGSVEVIPHGAPKRIQGKGGGGFVFIGTISPHKGPDLVSKAHRSAFSGKGPDLKIYGPLSSSPPKCDHPLLGPLKSNEVLATLAGADALVMGSIWPENYPMILVEAKSVGCPIIAPRIGGIPELVAPGVDGWLYNAGDVNDLIAKMQLAWASPRPPVKPPISLARQADLTERIYRELL